MKERLSGSTMMNILIVAVILTLPLMYAGLFTWAYKEPMDKLNAIDAVVINQDQGATAHLKSGKNLYLNLGADLSRELFADDAPGFHWIPAPDAESAQTGLQDGTYQVALWIPADLSANVAQLSELKDAPQTTLKLETNDGINYLTGTMAKSVALTLQNLVSQKGAGQFTDNLLLSFGDIHSGMETASDGAAKLADGTAQLEDGTAKLADGTNRLTASISQFANGGSELSSAIDRYTSGVDQLAGGAGRLGSGLTTYSAGVGKINDGINQLHQGAAKAVAGVPTLKSGVAQLQAATAPGSDPANPTLADGANLLENTLNAQATTPGIASGVDQLVELATGIAQACKNPLLASDPVCNGVKASLAEKHLDFDSLTVAANQLKAGVGQAHQAAQKMQQGVNAIHQGTLPLAATLTPSGNPAQPTLADFLNVVYAQTGKGSDPANPTLADGTAALAAGATELAQGAQSLQSGANSLTSNSAALRSGGHRLANATAPLQAGANQLSEGATALRSGTEKAFEGASELSTKLGEGAAKVPDLGASQSEKVAEVAANPIQVDALRANPVARNGVGFAPFFMCLAMWVGGIAIFLMFPALDKRRHSDEKFYISALRSMGLTAPFAILQALFVVAGLEILLDLSAKDLGLLFAVCIMTSLCFVSLNQAFVALMGYRGRFVSVLMLLLQITSMGATFPIETTPKFFQVLHPLLPMSYSASAIREYIAGADLPVFNGVWVVLLWWAIGIVLTFVGAKLHPGERPMRFDPAFAFPGRAHAPAPVASAN